MAMPSPSSELVQETQTSQNTSCYLEMSNLRVLRIPHFNHDAKSS